MNKLLLLVLAILAGAMGFRAFHRSSGKAQSQTALTIQEWQAIAARHTELEANLAVLRNDVRQKQDDLRIASRHPVISAELRRHMDWNRSKMSATTLAELRQQMGIGWADSPDYMLVHKQALKGLEYTRLKSGDTMTDTARDLLGLTPDEQFALRSVLQRVRAESSSPALVRTPPSGDVVAQYTVPEKNAEVQEKLSHHLAAGFANVIGPERAGLLLPDAWREFNSDLGPDHAETLTIRSVMTNGEPDLVWEMKGPGRRDSSAPVRYANYPSMWFLREFPGGWQTLADREGFQLPRKFH